MQRVFLIPHDPRWELDFARESGAVADALGGAVLSIHHIGSTAIPGLAAKPVVDMLAVAQDVSRLDERTAEMEALGYEVMGEFGLPGRRYFRKDNAAGERTHQVHAFAAGSPQIPRHLAFRDFMRAHPHHARVYGQLKQRLAKAHSHDISAYTDGKDAFIQRIDAMAAKWLASHA